MLTLGFSPKSIKHRITRGRLHPIWRGVYAIGRPELTQHGRWMAAVLSCGPQAVLSHESAAALWMIRPSTSSRIDLSMPAFKTRVRPNIVVHRRPTLTERDVTNRHAIPVTTPICTLIDIAAQLNKDQLEAAINEADRRDLADPEELRAALGPLTRRPGVRMLREVLDRRTFTLTDSELERRFLPIAREAGLSPPLTGRYLNGFKVDFFWPDLRLIVETDGLRYHRTAAQQARDRLRDQVQTAAGFTALRFTRAQVILEPARVQTILATVARRQRAAQ